jgi:hypothetical protein
MKGVGRNDGESLKGVEPYGAVIVGHDLKPSTTEQRHGTPDAKTESPERYLEDPAKFRKCTYPTDTRDRMQTWWIFRVHFRN